MCGVVCEEGLNHWTSTPIKDLGTYRPGGRVRVRNGQGRERRVIGVTGRYRREDTQEGNGTETCTRRETNFVGGGVVEGLITDE